MDTEKFVELKRVSGIEIKGQPSIHTVYAYVKAEDNGSPWHKINEVIALCTEPLGNMLGAEEVAIPFSVYEREGDLPDAIRRRIISDKGRLPMDVLNKEEGVVYAVLPNTDTTEGRGCDFIWTLVTDPLLANKIAQGNGPSGSSAKVAVIRLNELIEKHRPNIRRDKGQLSDELFSH